MGDHERITGPFPTRFEAAAEPVAVRPEVGDKVSRSGGTWGQGDLREPVRLYGEILANTDQYSCSEGEVHVKYLSYAIGAYAGQNASPVIAEGSLFRIGTKTYPVEECADATALSVLKR